MGRSISSLLPSRDSKPEAPVLSSTVQQDARILLEWARLSVPHFAALGNVVTREIGTYLGGYQAPVAVLRREVHYFDITTEQWKLLFPLSQDLPFFSMSSATFIAPMRLFLCGGMEHTACAPSALLLDRGQVHCLPNMKEKRADSGLSYHSYRRCVYVFGGFAELGSLHSSECFSLSSGEWSSLPDMNYARCAFNPCLCGELIYLCGGYCDSVETFEPRKNRFEVLPMLKLPEDAAASLSTASIVADTLTIITRRYSCSWRLSTQEKTADQIHERLQSWSSTTPVQRGGVLYIVNNQTTSNFMCMAVQLDSSKVLFRKTLSVRSY